MSNGKANPSAIWSVRVECKTLIFDGKYTHCCIFHRESSDVPTEFSLFEALRETIYSEVATLISQNENRPHFLIELFRQLQLLNSDYLRQRVLYAVQELVNRHLTEADVKDRDEEAAVGRVSVTSLWCQPWCHCEFVVCMLHSCGVSLLSRGLQRVSSRPEFSALDIVV